MDLAEFIAEWNNPSDKVLVYTSGSTGNPKPMWVEKKRMAASARLTCDFLGLKSGDTALLCMPLDYIAGKMVVVRSLVRNLKLVNVRPSGHPLAELTEPPVFAAMTPMQVYNSLQTARERSLLSAIKHLIIGGGAIDAGMEKTLHGFPNFVWSTYGMTETLSHVALRRLNGPDADAWYRPFDGVEVSIGSDGCLVVYAPLVNAEVLHTHDIAELHSDGRRFRILGRKDNVIDSGGIKIRMEDIESALRGYVQIPYIITKRKDRRFGEIVVMLVETDAIDDVRQTCIDVLPKYWVPRQFIHVEKIPFTETGKPARAEAYRIANDARYK